MVGGCTTRHTLLEVVAKLYIKSLGPTVWKPSTGEHLLRLEIVAKSSCSHDPEVNKQVDQHFLKLQRSGLIRECWRDDAELHGTRTFIKKSEKRERGTKKPDDALHAALKNQKRCQVKSSQVKTQ